MENERIGPPRKVLRPHAGRPTSSRTRNKGLGTVVRGHFARASAQGDLGEMRVGSWTYALPTRLRALVRPRQADRELAEELSFHEAMQTMAYMTDGMGGAEARQRAHREMGGIP